MRFAFLMSAAFVLLFGGLWVFLFIALFWGCLTIEEALVKWMSKR